VREARPSGAFDALCAIRRCPAYAIGRTYRAREGGEPTTGSVSRPFAVASAAPK